MSKEDPPHHTSMTPHTHTHTTFLEGKDKFEWKGGWAYIVDDCVNTFFCFFFLVGIFIGILLRGGEGTLAAKTKRTRWEE